ncbi:hypothetical protein B0T25DRAFT_565162 [Lasiosphaeria hispida]|uniref:Uncharacterized protein n=1 Tax=Lasiosphaeria hispida TaxID=260671 RepID=A0AAJ0HRV9_9PEZI|nr:hypothetical protein B0T25DRAFT_565162 [Lasiosphaeria hispida]
MMLTPSTALGALVGIAAFLASPAAAAALPDDASAALEARVWRGNTDVNAASRLPRAAWQCRG